MRLGLEGIGGVIVSLADLEIRLDWLWKWKQACGRKRRTAYGKGVIKCLGEKSGIRQEEYEAFFGAGGNKNTVSHDCSY